MTVGGTVWLLLLWGVYLYDCWGSICMTVGVCLYDCGGYSVAVTALGGLLV